MFKYILDDLKVYFIKENFYFINSKKIKSLVITIRLLIYDIKKNCIYFSFKY